jgi:DNA processing protein
LERFETAGAAIAALPELAQAGGRTENLKIPSRAEAEREILAVQKLGGRLVFWGGPEYPAALAELPDAPPVVAVLGDVSLLCAESIGIVGARNASANGMRIAGGLAQEISLRMTVVSGLARGIDAAAHEGAMRGGRTVAVIAGGLDVPYPPENAGLQARIAETGAVVAEAPLGTAPQGRHFPKRNRIIAGLVVGLVVIEAAPRSGSLLTARLANEAGRELFAVPGSPLDERCKGSNDLIRQGAHLTESAADVFANLPRRAAGFGEPAAGRPEPGPDAKEMAAGRREIPGLVGADPVGIDEIARRCQLSSAAISAVLLELELAGGVETLSGNRVARAAPL